MEFKNRLAKLVLVVCILVGGFYSFNHLDYATKANPVKIVEAIQSFDGNSTSFKPDFSGSKPQQNLQFKGQRGPAGHSRGENVAGNGIYEVIAFLGVFASALTITYLIDQFFKKKKAAA
ncbi:MAG: hypothetical protein ABFD08_17580 [Syntrophomonas sp.]